MDRDEDGATMTESEPESPHSRPRSSTVAAVLAAECVVQGKVEEDDHGKKSIRMAFPPEFQGHYMAFDMHANLESPTGPFRFEYTLGSEFDLYRTDLANETRSKWHSNLDLGVSMSKICDLKFSYTTGRNAKDGPKDALVAFAGEDGRIDRIVVEMPEEELDYARQVAEQIVNGLLDYLVFTKGLPLKVVRLDVFETKTKHLRRRFSTIPYTRRSTLEVQDMDDAKTIPPGARASLRLFREAVGSSNVFYRFLCFYRVHEALEKLRTVNNKAVKAKGKTPRRNRTLLGESEVARRYYPALIGKPVGDLLEQLRSELRINIAHMNFDDFDQMILDPGNTGAAHKVDIANALLEQMTRGVVAGELEFMATHGLR